MIYHFYCQLHKHKLPRAAHFGDMLICVSHAQNMSEIEKEMQRQAQSEKRERPKQEDLFLGLCTSTSVNSFCYWQLSG